MANLNPISFESNWRYYPTEDFDPVYGTSQLDESSWGILKSLDEWPRDLIAINGTLNLQKHFDLEPIGDVCVRYVLHVETAPAKTEVFVNGWHAGTMQPAKALVSDVTDFVTLENNVVLLKVSLKGALAGVWLQPVPCEEL